MFLFRLPWDDGISTYLDGDIILPIFGCQTTTETRLFVKNLYFNDLFNNKESISNNNNNNNIISNESKWNFKEYNHKIYNDSLHWHNNITRLTIFYHEYYNNNLGIDYCYDCSREIDIWINYIKNNKIENISIKKQIFKLIKKASRLCGSDCKRQDLFVYDEIDSREIIDGDGDDNDKDNNNNKRQKLEKLDKLCYYCQSSPHITICNEDDSNINTTSGLYQISSNLLLYTTEKNKDNKYNSSEEPVLTDLEAKSYFLKYYIDIYLDKIIGVYIIT